MFKVYQIQLTNAMIDKVNAEGFLSVPAMKVKMDLGLDREFTQDMFEHYELVATCEAKDLEDVFKIGNIRHERMNIIKQMHSVSVGDVIENPEGKMFVVRNMGFDEIFVA